MAESTRGDAVHHRRFSNGIIFLCLSILFGYCVCEVAYRILESVRA